tara:strand:- start:496 stop:918 length:423 start_codon:yes stop_codon:yes gene_type:complete
MKENILYDNNLFKNNYQNLNEINLFNQFNQLNKLINSSIIIIKKIDLILLDWFQHDIINRSSYIITQVDSFTPIMVSLIKESYSTVRIYNIIGSNILNNINYVIYISGFVFFTIITIQCISCSILIYLYREHKLRVYYIK